jgi:hypothetical protein
MIKIILLLSIAALAPITTFAHEQRVLDIHGTLYQIVVGSLNEPIVVGDKTGLDLTIKKIGVRKYFEKQVRDGKIPENATPVLDLEKSLKVEIYSDAKTMPMELSAAWGQPGKYKTLFYPTSTTKFSYHIFGIIDGSEIDERFTCNEKGHDMKDMLMLAGKTHTVADVPASVLERVLYSGHSFGCAQAKADFGFPDTAHEQNTPNYAAIFALCISVISILFCMYITLRKKVTRHT